MQLHIKPNVSFFLIIFSDIIALENGRVSMKSTAEQEFLKRTYIAVHAVLSQRSHLLRNSPLQPHRNIFCCLLIES